MNLHEILPDNCIFKNVSLSDYTSMHTGGPADFLVTPESEDQIPEIFEYARETGLSVFVMGNGSNILVSDEGYRGIILHIGKKMSRIESKGNHLYAQAGSLIASVARIAAENNLTGLEFASGIPGSTGGAVCMNAGAYGGEISQVFENAKVVCNGSILTIPACDMAFGYRKSIIQEKEMTVLSAAFRLSPGNADSIISLMSELNNRRHEKQPLQYPSCGSFFKRPCGFYAGALIEQAGLKGFSVGDAQVSEKHAGFIINRGHATSAQVYSLMRHIQESVYTRFNVMLEPEVKLIGNFES